jgi:hypothetical protein
MAKKIGGHYEIAQLKCTFNLTENGCSQPITHLSTHNYKALLKVRVRHLYWWTRQCSEEWREVTPVVAGSWLEAIGSILSGFLTYLYIRGPCTTSIVRLVFLGQNMGPWRSRREGTFLVWVTSLLKAKPYPNWLYPIFSQCHW